MSLRRPSSLPEVFAQELRDQLLLGRWQDYLPGLLKLSQEFGVSRETVEKALELLTDDGVLAPPQHGKKRKVQSRPVPQMAGPKNRPRVGWLGWRSLSTMDRCTRDIISEVTRLAQAEGVDLFVAPLTGSQIKQAGKELETLTHDYPVDAWIYQGANAEIATWFAEHMEIATPCLAVGGRVGEANSAQIGFDVGGQMETSLEHLIQLGHRRIVVPLPPQILGGLPARVERVFRERMQAHGIRVIGEYNLPILDGSLPNWLEQLQGLFGLTPPTAFILQQGVAVAGLTGFLHRKGLRIPQDVSLVMEADDPLLQWLHPEASQFVFSTEKMSRTIWKWLREALDGHPQPCRQLIKGQFMPGKTTGPVARGNSVQI